MSSRKRFTARERAALTPRERAALNPTYHGIGMSVVSGNKTFRTRDQAEAAISGLIGPSPFRQTPKTGYGAETRPSAALRLCRRMTIFGRLRRSPRNEGVR